MIGIRFLILAVVSLVAEAGFLHLAKYDDRLIDDPSDENMEDGGGGEAAETAMEMEETQVNDQMSAAGSDAAWAADIGSSVNDGDKTKKTPWAADLGSSENDGDKTKKTDEDADAATETGDADSDKSDADPDASAQAKNTDGDGNQNADEAQKTGGDDNNSDEAKTAAADGDVNSDAAETTDTDADTIATKDTSLKKGKGSNKGKKKTVRRTRSKGKKVSKSKVDDKPWLAASAAIAKLAQSVEGNDDDGSSHEESADKKADSSDKGSAPSDSDKAPPEETDESSHEEVDKKNRDESAEETAPPEGNKAPAKKTKKTKKKTHTSSHKEPERENTEESAEEPAPPEGITAPSKKTHKSSHKEPEGENTEESVEEPAPPEGITAQKGKTDEHLAKARKSTSSKTKLRKLTAKKRTEGEVEKVMAPTAHAAIEGNAEDTSVAIIKSTAQVAAKKVLDQVSELKSAQKDQTERIAQVNQKMDKIYQILSADKVSDREVAGAKATKARANEKNGEEVPLAHGKTTSKDSSQMVPTTAHHVASKTKQLDAGAVLEPRAANSVGNDAPMKKVEGKMNPGMSNSLQATNSSKPQEASLEPTKVSADLNISTKALVSKPTKSVGNATSTKGEAPMVNKSQIADVGVRVPPATNKSVPLNFQDKVLQTASNRSNFQATASESAKPVSTDSGINAKTFLGKPMTTVSNIASKHEPPTVSKSQTSDVEVRLPPAINKSVPISSQDKVLPTVKAESRAMINHGAETRVVPPVVDAQKIIEREASQKSDIARAKATQTSEAIKASAQQWAKKRMEELKREAAVTPNVGAGVAAFGRSPVMGFVPEQDDATMAAETAAQIPASDVGATAPGTASAEYMSDDVFPEEDADGADGATDDDDEVLLSIGTQEDALPEEDIDNENSEISEDDSDSVSMAKTDAKDDSTDGDAIVLADDDDEVFHEASEDESDRDDIFLEDGDDAFQD